VAAYELSSWPNRWNQDSAPGGQFLTKKTAQRVLVAPPHSRGVGVLCDEVGVVNMGATGKKLVNSSLLR
jgi:hypothetical protein